MNKSFLTTTVLFSMGALVASAENNIGDRISGCVYESAFGRYTGIGQSYAVGSNGRTGFTNYNWDRSGTDYNIHLGQDARYEITFDINFQVPSDAEFPIFNIYLASGNSIVYGNYYDVNGGRGAANAFLYAGYNVSIGDNQYGASSFALYPHEGYQQYPGWIAPNRQLTSLTATGNTNAGVHRYTIYVESYADETKADKIKFQYSGPNDSDGTWSSDQTLSSYGIGADAVLDVGYFLDQGSTSVALDGSFKKFTRTVVQTEEPAPDPVTPPATPDLPEPSAFGLLAGMGALALVASRRRRK